MSEKNFQAFPEKCSVDRESGGSIEFNRLDGIDFKSIIKYACRAFFAAIVAEHTD